MLQAGHAGRTRKAASLQIAMKSFAFSALTVCGLAELDGHSERGVTHVLSILDPDWPEPGAFEAFDPHSRATFRFHDAIEPAPGVLAPQEADVEAILAFARDAGDIGHLLIHCHAGISRSTAAMLAILAQAHPHESERSLADRITRIRPQAWPNLRMVVFADALLGRGGRLTAALGPLYARRLKAQPELAEAMRLGGRGREVEMAFTAAGA
jgi:predicted protein tyrosine phosphatase